MSDRFSNWTEIGKGGQATVYKAYDEHLRIDVAIKVLHLDEDTSSHKWMDMLRSEIMISRSLRHRNICAIHDFYNGPRGFGVVMDLIPGCDLTKWVQRNSENLAETTAERLALIVKIAEALDVAHQEIVHRDLKPANVRLRNEDVSDPVIMDFGIAKQIGGDQDNMIAGTPRYMCPEQFLTPSTIDRRVDVYALGIMAYELLAGRTPINSLRQVKRRKEVFRVDARKIAAPSSYNAAVPSALDALVARMISYDRDDRPDSMVAVLRELLAIELDDSIKLAGKGKARREYAIQVPSGDYLIGSPPAKGDSTEKPSRPVQLKSFAIDAFPVTNSDYREFIHSTGLRSHKLLDDPVFGQANHPVVGITHEEARAFALWAGGRLPSELEWECAARGGVKFCEYPWGPEDPDVARANLDRVKTCTTPVSAHPTGRNKIGLWDMCGNVWEWCDDGHEPHRYKTIRIKQKDPRGPEEADKVNVRGGSFLSFDSTGRCAHRGSADPKIRRKDIGFRVVYDS